jgi:predicted PurR-regulated permease PerM
VRSQLLIGLVMGVLYSLGFMILGVPLPITVGMLAGVLNFIPYLGTLIGLVLALLFLALDYAGIGRFLGVLGVFALVQSIEGYYLTPKLIGSRLHLHPLWVLTGLLIGGNLFGLVGIILAVPVIAIAKVLFGFLEDIYRPRPPHRSGPTCPFIINFRILRPSPGDPATTPPPNHHYHRRTPLPQQ